MQYGPSKTPALLLLTVAVGMHVLTTDLPCWRYSFKLSPYAVIINTGYLVPSSDFTDFHAAVSFDCEALTGFGQYNSQSHWRAAIFSALETEELHLCRWDDHHFIVLQGDDHAPLGLQVEMLLTPHLHLPLNDMITLAAVKSLLHISAVNPVTPSLHTKSSTWIHSNSNSNRRKICYVPQKADLWDNLFLSNPGQPWSLFDTYELRSVCYGFLKGQSNWLALCKCFKMPWVVSLWIHWEPQLSNITRAH